MVVVGAVAIDKFTQVHDVIVSEPLGVQQAVGHLDRLFRG